MSIPVEIVAWAGVVIAAAECAVVWRTRVALRALERHTGAISEKVHRLLATGVAREELAALERSWTGRFAEEREQSVAVEKSRVDAARRQEAMLIDRLASFEAGLERWQRSSRAPVLAEGSFENGVWTGWLQGGALKTVRAEWRSSGLPEEHLRVWLEGLPPFVADSEADAADWLQKASAGLIHRLGAVGLSPTECTIAAERALAAMRPSWPEIAAGLRLRTCYPGMAFDCDWMQLLDAGSRAGPTVAECVAFGIDRNPPTAAAVLRPAIVVTY